MISRLTILSCALVCGSIVLVSALPAPADDTSLKCLSPTATPEDLGPSAKPDDEARGWVCRENGEVVGRTVAID